MKFMPITIRFIAGFATLLLAGQTMADTVFVTACVPGTSTVTSDGTYSDTASGSTAVAGAAPGSPSRTHSRYFSNNFSNSVGGVSHVILTPALGSPGGVYQIDHNFSSTAGNVSTNISLTATCTFGGTLSFWNTGTNFTRAAGTPNTQWKTLGYVTNNPGSAAPTIAFGYLSGIVNAGASQRLLTDCFRFTLLDPCLQVPEVSVTGPLASNLNEVVVAGVTAAATNINVYQDSGGGMVLIGSKPSGVTAGNNSVGVTGLVKGAQVAATQVIDGQEGCVPTTGKSAGGGANPRVRVVLSIRETSSTGPVGTPGITASTNIHFLGASFRTGGAPGDGIVAYPSNEWQTLTFDADPQVVLGDVSNVAGSVISGFYAANDTVAVRVYALTNDSVLAIPFYSLVGATSATVSSNDLFGVDWTWDAVPGAEGYRLLRNLNGAGFTEYQDVYGSTVLNDISSNWGPGSTVTPAVLQNGPSVQWSAAESGDVGKTNNIGTVWGVLDAIAIAIDDLTDTGPFELYLDNLQNGSTVFQDFEGFVNGAQEAGFRAPSFSGSTGGNLLSAPNQSTASNGAADSGTKSVRVRFQWNGTNATQWLRLTTSGVGNPQVNLFDPISLRMLLLPVNASPVAPPAPSLSIALVNGEVVLTWPGAHRLQGSTNVVGPYAPVVGAPFLAPYTNAPTEEVKFFRLVD